MEDQNQIKTAPHPKQQQQRQPVQTARSLARQQQLLMQQQQHVQFVSPASNNNPNTSRSITLAPVSSSSNQQPTMISTSSMIAKRTENNNNNNNNILTTTTSSSSSKEFSDRLQTLAVHGITSREIKQQTVFPSTRIPAPLFLYKQNAAQMSLGMNLQTTSSTIYANNNNNASEEPSQYFFSTSSPSDPSLALQATNNGSLMISASTFPENNNNNSAASFASMNVNRKRWLPAETPVAFDRMEMRYLAQVFDKLITPGDVADACIPNERGKRYALAAAAPPPDYSGVFDDKNTTKQRLQLSSGSYVAASSPSSSSSPALRKEKLAQIISNLAENHPANNNNSNTNNSSSSVVISKKPSEGVPRLAQKMEGLLIGLHEVARLIAPASQELTAIATLGVDKVKEILYDLLAHMEHLEYEAKREFAMRKEMEIVAERHKKELDDLNKEVEKLSERMAKHYETKPEYLENRKNAPKILLPDQVTFDELAQKTRREYDAYVPAQNKTLQRTFVESVLNTATPGIKQIISGEAGAMLAKKKMKEEKLRIANSNNDNDNDDDNNNKPITKIVKIKVKKIVKQRKLVPKTKKVIIKKEQKKLVKKMVKKNVWRRNPRTGRDEQVETDVEEEVEEITGYIEQEIDEPIGGFEEKEVDVEIEEEIEQEQLVYPTSLTTTSKTNKYKGDDKKMIIGRSLNDGNVESDEDEKRATDAAVQNAILTSSERACRVPSDVHQPKRRHPPITKDVSCDCSDLYYYGFFNSQDPKNKHSHSHDTHHQHQFASSAVLAGSLTLKNNNNNASTSSAINVLASPLLQSPSSPQQQQQSSFSTSTRLRKSGPNSNSIVSAAMMNQIHFGESTTNNVFSPNATSAATEQDSLFNFELPAPRLFAHQGLLFVQPAVRLFEGAGSICGPTSWVLGQEMLRTSLENSETKNAANSPREVRERLKNEKFAFIGELKPKALELAGGLEWGGTPSPSYLMNNNNNNNNSNATHVTPSAKTPQQQQQNINHTPLQKEESTSSSTKPSTPLRTNSNSYGKMHVSPPSTPNQQQKQEPSENINNNSSKITKKNAPHHNSTNKKPKSSQKNGSHHDNSNDASPNITPSASTDFTASGHNNNTTSSKFSPKPPSNQNQPQQQQQNKNNNNNNNSAPPPPISVTSPAGDDENVRNLNGGDSQLEGSLSLSQRENSGVLVPGQGAGTFRRLGNTVVSLIRKRSNQTSSTFTAATAETQTDAPPKLVSIEVQTLPMKDIFGFKFANPSASSNNNNNMNNNYTSSPSGRSNSTVGGGILNSTFMNASTRDKNNNKNSSTSQQQQQKEGKSPSSKELGNTQSGTSKKQQQKQSAKDQANALLNKALGKQKKDGASSSPKNDNNNNNTLDDDAANNVLSSFQEEIGIFSNGGGGANGKRIEALLAGKSAEDMLDLTSVMKSRLSMHSDAMVNTDVTLTNKELWRMPFLDAIVTANVRHFDGMLAHKVPEHACVPDDFLEELENETYFFSLMSPADQEREIGIAIKRILKAKEKKRLRNKNRSDEQKQKKLDKKSKAVGFFDDTKDGGSNDDDDDDDASSSSGSSSCSSLSSSSTSSQQHKNGNNNNYNSLMFKQAAKRMAKRRLEKNPEQGENQVTFDWGGASFIVGDNNNASMMNMSITGNYYENAMGRSVVSFGASTTMMNLDSPTATSLAAIANRKQQRTMHSNTILYSKLLPPLWRGELGQRPNFAGARIKARDWTYAVALECFRSIDVLLICPSRCFAQNVIEFVSNKFGDKVKQARPYLLDLLVNAKVQTLSSMRCFAFIQLAELGGFAGIDDLPEIRNSTFLFYYLFITQRLQRTLSFRGIAEFTKGSLVLNREALMALLDAHLCHFAASYSQAFEYEAERRSYYRTLLSLKNLSQDELAVIRFQQQMPCVVEGTKCPDPLPVVQNTANQITNETDLWGKMEGLNTAVPVHADVAIYLMSRNHEGLVDLAVERAQKIHRQLYEKDLMRSVLASNTASQPFEANVLPPPQMIALQLLPVSTPVAVPVHRKIIEMENLNGSVRTN